jgi:DNA-binding beta-propeller fold protein YncE
MYSDVILVISILSLKCYHRSSVTKDSVSGVVEDVATEEIDGPDGLAIDWINDLLYLTDTGHDHIQVSRLDGTHRRTIVKDDSLDEPRAIIVDPIRG